MRSTIRSVLLAFAVSAAIAACGDDGTEADGDMNRELDVAFERASAIDQELSSHESAVSAATDVSAIDRRRTPTSRSRVRR